MTSKDVDTFSMLCSRVLPDTTINYRQGKQIKNFIRRWDDEKELSLIQKSRFSKRITAQNELYFLRYDGYKTRYDPRVPREIRFARFNLNTLVGSMPNENWAVSRDIHGRKCYINRKTSVIHFTDPRLVACRKFLACVLYYSTELIPTPDLPPPPTIYQKATTWTYRVFDKIFNLPENNTLPDVDDDDFEAMMIQFD